MPLQTTCTPIVNVQQFRSDFNEFTDITRFPDSAINYWLVVATLLLNPSRWLNILQLGVELYVAHNITLEDQDTQAAIAGGWPGMSKGVVTAESAGAVSGSYDAGPDLEEGAGHWDLTRFWARFIRLAKRAGAGPVQVGPCGPLAGTVSGSSNTNGPGWGGPPVKPGWLGS